MGALHVQTVGNGPLGGTGGPSTTQTLAITGTVIGNKLIVPVTNDTTNGATVTVDDNAAGGGAANVYTLLDSQGPDPNSEQVKIFWCDLTRGGNFTITAHFSGSGEQVIGVAASEYSGVKAGAPGTKNSRTQALPTTTTDATCDASPATLTPPTQPGILYGLTFETNTDAVPAAGTGFNSRGNFWSWAFSSGTPLSCRIEDKAISSLSAVAATFTAGANKSHETFAIYLEEPSATVVQPPADLSQRPGISSRISAAMMSTVSGAAALLPLTPVAGKQFYPSYPDPIRRPAVIDRDASGSSAPIVPQASTAVGTSFFAQEQVRPRPRLTALDGSGSGAPVSGIPTFPAITWSVPSPMIIRSPSAADGGGGAISPLNPTFWFPDVPDRAALRRPIFEAPSVFLRPLVTTTTYVLDPSAERVALRRPLSEDASTPGWLGLVVARDIAWARDSDRPATRRIVVEDRSDYVHRTHAAADLSWSLQGSPVPLPARPPPARGDVPAAVILPLFQPQAPSWLSPPADVVRRDVKPQDYGSGPVLLALVQAKDLSWMAESPRATPRPLPRHEPSFTPQATTVTLSAWGWIPEVPSRPGLRTVVSAFVSALVPPAIASSMPWGWIPEGPDRGFRRAPNTHQDQPPIGVLTTQALGWLPESPIPLRPRRTPDPSSASFLGQPPVATWGWLHDQANPTRKRPVADDPAQLPPSPSVLAWGWLPEQPHPLRRRAVLEDPAQVPPAPQVVAWGWFVEGPQPRAQAPRPREDAQTPIRPMAGLPAYWQHWQVGPRAPRPVVSGFNETPLLVLVPASLPPMPRGDSSFVVARSATALRAALQAGHGMILVPTGAISVGALKAIMQEVGAWRAVLTE